MKKCLARVAVIGMVEPNGSEELGGLSPKTVEYNISQAFAKARYLERDMDKTRVRSHPDPEVCDKY